MFLLIRGDLHQILVEGVGESSIEKITTGIVLETLSIESCLKVFESQCIVEDVCISNSTFANRFGLSSTDGNADGKKNRRFHRGR